MPAALTRRGRGGRPRRRQSASWHSPALAQAFAGQFDATGIVYDAVADCVGEGWNPDQIMPAVYGNLAGDDEGAFVVTVLDDFQEIARLVGEERLPAPVIRDERLRA